MIEIIIKVGLTFLCSGLIFFVMMKRQDRKIKNAEREFKLLLKSRGINPDLIERKRK